MTEKQETLVQTPVAKPRANQQEKIKPANAISSSAESGLQEPKAKSEWDSDQDEANDCPQCKIFAFFL